MTKEEIKQKFFDIIGERLRDYKPSPEAVKDLAKAFKAVCEIDDNDKFMKQLAEMPPIEQTGACKQKCNGHCQNKPVDDDDGGFGQCD